MSELLMNRLLEINTRFSEWWSSVNNTLGLGVGTPTPKYISAQHENKEWGNRQ